MASSNEEIGFDLDLLLPSPTADNATAKLEYLRKSIRLVKTRTILSNTLVTQILGLRKELDSAKNSLVASNRERDEWYTSYNHGCASVKNLEMEIKKLQIKNKELEEKCFITTNQYDAVKSHAHQLQLLVKENKKKRGAAKIENVLDTYNKDHENTITLLKQNEQTLLHDISLMRDILIGKKKLQQGHKRLILKYMKLKVLSDSDEFIFGDEDIQDDDNIIFNGLATFCDENTLDNIDRKDQNSQTLIKKKINENNVDMIVIDEKTNPADNGHNSDCGNEGISVDTGRGSSVSDLALSDTEKCLHSPDYVMDSSPLSIDAIDSNKDQVKVIDVTTSPPISTRDIATSPIIFEDVSSNHHDSSVDVVHSVDRGESPTHIITREFATSPTHIITREFSTSPTHIITRDFSTSPTNIITLEVSTSPIQKHGQEEITSCEFFNNRTSGYVHDRESNSVRKEKECMELNNSKNLFDDSSIDNEIETILNTMRINYELVTPIPLSPSKSRNINITQGTNELETLNSKAIKSFSATFNEMSENLKEIKRMLINRDGAYTRRNSIQQDKNENIQTFISDLRDGNLTEEKSTNNIVVRDNDILPLRTKSPSNKARELEGEFNDSVSAYSINSVLTDTSGDRIIQNPKRVKNLSTNNTVVATGDKIRQESQSTKIPSNKAQSEELNGSVPITSGPTTELSTNLVASDFDNLHESRIDISSSNTSKRIQIIDSRILHSTTTFASDKLSVNNIDDVETSQEEIGNMSIQNTTFRLQHDSSKGFEENTDTINDSISEVETTNLSTLNQNRNNETEYAYETLQEHCQKKNMKKKKLTKLDKLRKKMLPKSKIRCTTPVKKICKKPKPVPIYTKVVKESDSAASLNDRSIYENAVKVMAVINSKPKEVSNEEGSSSHRAQNISTTVTPVSPEKSNFKQHNKNNNEMPLSPMSAMITRSRSKNDKNSPCSVVRNLELLFDTTSSPNSFSKNESDINAVTNSGTQGTRKRRKGASNDQSEIACKRMLRSSTVKKQPILETEIELEKSSAKHLSHTSDKNRNKDITNKNISHKSADFQSSKVVSDHQTLFNKSDSVNENNKAYKNKNSKERVIMDKNENTCVPNTPRNVSVILNENISQKSADVQTSTVVSDHQTLLNKSDSVHENNKACKNKNSKMRVTMDEYENNCEPNTPKNVSGIPNKNVSYKSADVQSSKVVSDHQTLFNKSDSVKENNKARKRKNNKMRDAMDKYENNLVPNTPKNVSDPCVELTDIRRDNVVSYSDLQLFSNNNVSRKEKEKSVKDTVFESSHKNPKNSILCVMLQKYGIDSVKNAPKNVAEPATNSVCKMIENNITEILALPATEVKDALNDFVAEIQSLEDNLFIMGLMKYLKDPERRNELFNTVYSPPAPCMTKPEQVLIYVVTQLNSSSPTNDFVVKILDNIEYILFKLNQTPEFATVESMSHFYAVLCRYFNAKSRLRLFILDAMYCIQFKAIALIKQCLDVWMHILPLAHMGIAKNPLVTCLVYLLHFYKCEDKYNRVQAMRTILNRKYFYEITEWNEPKILEMFRNALKEMKDIAVEKKMLRIALIIMAKRHGPKWCQHNIIKNLLLPMIDSQNVDNKVKIFCISMIGPLLKPYPVEMKVHCEIIINQLQNMMQQKLPCAMHEAILMSLVYMSRHNPYRVNQALLSWEAKRVSRELENVLRDYVREKSVHVWKINLSKIGNSNRE